MYEYKKKNSGQKSQKTHGCTIQIKKYLLHEKIKLLW